jgi:SMC interacting uncharacterized protein involved in chromosome segregation
MLDLYNLRDGQLTQLRVASTKMRERLSALQTQRVELEHAIEDLERTVEIVDGMLKERAQNERNGNCKSQLTAVLKQFTLKPSGMPGGFFFVNGIDQHVC